MDLNINSPSYYTKKFGVIDEIYDMCKDIRNMAKGKNYSSVINIVGITPIIAPYDILSTDLFKEIKKCELKYGFASVSFQIDYEEFIRADTKQKKKLIINNILTSMKSIHKKAKINYIDFEADVMQYCKEHEIFIK